MQLSSAAVEDLPSIVLKALPGTYALLNLPRTDAIPAWLAGQKDMDDLISLTRSAYGFSVICPDAWVPSDLVADQVVGWRVLRVEAPRDWAMHGLYARLTQPLADDAISIYIVGSYNADHVLVRQADFARTTQILSRFSQIV